MLVEGPLYTWRKRRYEGIGRKCQRDFPSIMLYQGNGFVEVGHI
jgi:hypothetical protein